MRALSLLFSTTKVDVTFSCWYNPRHHSSLGRNRLFPQCVFSRFWPRRDPESRAAKFQRNRTLFKQGVALLLWKQKIKVRACQRVYQMIFHPSYFLHQLYVSRLLFFYLPFSPSLLSFSKVLFVSDQMLLPPHIWESRMLSVRKISNISPFVAEKIYLQSTAKREGVMCG